MRILTPDEVRNRQDKEILSILVALIVAATGAVVVLGLVYYLLSLLM